MKGVRTRRLLKMWVCSALLALLPRHLGVLLAWEAALDLLGRVMDTCIAQVCGDMDDLFGAGMGDWDSAGTWRV